MKYKPSSTGFSKTYSLFNFSIIKSFSTAQRQARHNCQLRSRISGNQYKLLLAMVALFLVLTAPEAGAATRELTLSPSGSDSASGSRSDPLRTLGAAWRKIPLGNSGSWLLRLKAGSYRSGAPVYWESRGGPITIESVDGRDAARLPGMNVYRVNKLTMRGVRLDDGGDVFHCELCKRVTLDHVTLRGDGAQETIKINQSSDVTVTDSDISGAGDNNFDAVAVRRIKLLRNHFHDAEDWCAYAKGGSTEVIVRGNLFSECGTGGFTAGQGTGMQFMASPFTHYEASSVLIEGNSVRDTEGAAFGVGGGANVLIRRNIATRIGSRSHVLEVGYGSRSCDGRPGDAGRSRCASYIRAGGWGTTVVDDGDNFIRIPNRNVLIYDNVISNPVNQASQWQVFSVAGARPGASGGVPRGRRADDGLRIVGNAIYDGGPEHSLGLGNGDCRSGSSCAPERVLANNEINGRIPTVTQRSDGWLEVSGWAASLPIHKPPAPTLNGRVRPEPLLWRIWP